MAIQLTNTASTQISKKRIRRKSIIKINGVDRSAYLKGCNISYSRDFGSASASFTLSNAGGIFGEGGLYRIKVGDLVEFFEQFETDTTVFKKFYGLVEQRGIRKAADQREITVTCLDYISILQKLDIDIDIEGTKVEITEERLTPVFLPSPNDSLAQIFNFANNQIALNPPPLITIRPQATTTFVGESPQYDGFNVKYAEGQLLLGTPLNALDNYDVYSTSYFFYTQGVYAEDIIEAIIKAEDGYGGYLFGEASSQAVIDNHLTSDFSTVEGRTTDYLSPNYIDVEATIKTNLTSAVTEGATSISVADTSGFPTSGTGSINGDTFTWTGKTATTFTGIPSSGSNSLKAKPSGSYVQYVHTYDAGQIWYLTYSNLVDNLTTSNVHGIGSSTVQYVDKRYGRIFLDNAISTASNVTHTANYNFKTLQASGIALNRMRFNPRDTENRFEALNTVRKYLPPNYVIRTEGDDCIWASLLTQKVTPDYTLNLIQQLDYLEDEDLYTRVIMYGKNSNPENVMLREGVQFVSTGQNFKATATQSELQYETEDGNYLVYKTTITDAGRIDLSVFKPVVYINNVPVNDKPQIISLMPVVITVTQRTETSVQQKTSGDPDISIRQYFYYKVRFAHTSIDPSQPIYLYDAVGVTMATIAPYTSSMDYGSGVYNVPGDSQNGTYEQVSTASYTVFYSTSGIDIDIDTVRFRISKQLIPSKDFAIVAATFQYWTAVTPFSDVGSIIDGRFDTQVQTEFYAEPPNGLPYAILDLGQITNIQAVDFVAGFYKPDDIRKFDIDFRFSLQYSLDNIDYYSISPEAENMQLAGGEHKSLEEKDLGPGFQTRYFKLSIEDVKKIQFNKLGTATTDPNVGIWPIAFTEISAYDNIILKAEAKLIPTTQLTADVDVTSLASSGLYQTTLSVSDTTGFEDPASGETATAYIGTDSFTYTGLTATSFVGVEGLSEDHSTGDYVTQELESDTDVPDTDFVLPQLGDRLYKKILIDNENLYTQSQLNNLAKAYLVEFVKDHSKATVDVLYCPYLKVGQTVALTDTYNDKDAVNYFIESVEDRDGFYTLTLARYPDFSFQGSSTVITTNTTISVFETISANDPSGGLNLSNNIINLNVNDSNSLTENIILISSININLFDSITVTDVPTVTNPTLNPRFGTNSTVRETPSITESITVTIS